MWIPLAITALAVALVIQLELFGRSRRRRALEGREKRWSELVRALELRGRDRRASGRGRHGEFALRAEVTGVVVLVPCPPGTMLSQLSVMPRGRAYVPGTSPTSSGAARAYAQGDRLRAWLNQAPGRWVEEGQLAVELAWEVASPAEVRRVVERLAQAAVALAGE